MTQDGQAVDADFDGLVACRFIDTDYDEDELRIQTGCQVVHRLPNRDIVVTMIRPRFCLLARAAAVVAMAAAVSTPMQRQRVRGRLYSSRQHRRSLG